MNSSTEMEMEFKGSRSRSEGSIEVPVMQVIGRQRRYSIENENFASGCFGKILLARDNEDKQVVIKKLSKVSNSSTDVMKEIEAGKALRHSNIAKFYEHFSCRENDYLVFERVHGSDLFSIIEKRGFVPFSNKEAKKIFKQILKAIMYAHENDVVHRDIKLENILMDASGKITVIDFGLCDLVKKGNESEKFCGSLDYVAPEVLYKRSYSGFLADSFSLGIVLYALLFAEFPFVTAERVKAIRRGVEPPKICYTPEKIKKWKVKASAQDLITKMLKPNPSQRLSLEEVKQHPWLKKKSKWVFYP